MNYGAMFAICICVPEVILLFIGYVLEECKEKKERENRAEREMRRKSCRILWNRMRIRYEIERAANQ